MSSEQVMPEGGSQVRAVVAGHASFAAGIISAVDQITGLGGCFRGVSGLGLSLDDIQRSIVAALDETGAKVVFTDLPAGSCTMVSRKLLRDRSDVLLITGTNLPILLDFAMQALPDASDTHHAARTALERGRSAMTAYTAA